MSGGDVRQDKKKAFVFSAFIGNFFQSGYPTSDLHCLSCVTASCFFENEAMPLHGGTGLVLDNALCVRVCVFHHKDVSFNTCSL